MSDGGEGLATPEADPCAGRGGAKALRDELAVLYGQLRARDER